MTLSGGTLGIQPTMPRWADMSLESTSEEELSKSGAPLFDDSYRGMPISFTEAFALNRDFPNLMTQHRSNVFVEDKTKGSNATERSNADQDLPAFTLSLQEMDAWDGDDDTTNPPRWTRSQSDTSSLCNSSTGTNKTPRKRAGRGKDKSKEKEKREFNDANPNEHQVCFNWNRKHDGCSDVCPNGRQHACEFCGSTEHRGIDHTDAVGKEDGEDQDQGKAELQTVEVEVVHDPIDFGFLLRGASPIFSTKKSAPLIVQEFSIEEAPPSSFQEGDQCCEPCDDVENEDSNSKRARLWNSQALPTGQPEHTPMDVIPQLELMKEEKPGCAHQRCFEWSRKADGCSFPCPNHRLHVCEFCGSPDHRGVDHVGEKILPKTFNANRKRTRLGMKTMLQSSGSPMPTPRRSLMPTPRRAAGGKVRSLGSTGNTQKCCVCFDWSRKIDGCSEQCPKGRVHSCEFCGSTAHRGIQCNSKGDSKEK